MLYTHKLVGDARHTPDNGPRKVYSNVQAKQQGRRRWLTEILFGTDQNVPVTPGKKNCQALKADIERLVRYTILFTYSLTRNIRI